MTLETHANHAAVSASACALVSAALRGCPSLVLGLPTGRTPIALYEGLVAAGLDWSAARTFNVDEFAGVPAHDKASFRAFMEGHLFSGVNLPPSQIGFLLGDTGDDLAECERYERAIAAAGGIDLLILGLGANGHIGFNEPGPVLIASTHVATLHASSRAASADRFGGDAARVPSRALTMGMGQVLRAREILMIATGPSKTDAVAAMVRGSLTTSCPASWLQVHPAVRLMLDDASAAGLR